MDRMVLRDDQWERIAPLVPGKVGDPGRSGADNELRVSASRADAETRLNERGGAAGRGRGGNFNVLGTDPAIWKFQVPGFLRPQSLTEWPNCHKGNSKLITTKMTEAFCERH